VWLRYSENLVRSCSTMRCQEVPYGDFRVSNRFAGYIRREIRSSGPIFSRRDDRALEGSDLEFDISSRRHIQCGPLIRLNSRE
jgi:hypothetical protein